MMLKLIAASTTVLLLAFSSPASAQKNSAKTKSDVRFINDIEVSIGSPAPEPAEKESKFAVFKNLFSRKQEEVKITPSSLTVSSVSSLTIEAAHSLQFKYALLMNTEVEEVQNLPLFLAIDEWYGTPYVYGGTTKHGIDCSAFVQTLYATFLGIMLPRTAREQYKTTRSISRTDLRQGDLIFFNTTGGVSHVGMYLQNNKFVHAATSGGVMISDLFEEYWVKRFIAAGRYEREDTASVLSQPQP